MLLDEFFLVGPGISIAPISKLASRFPQLTRRELNLFFTRSQAAQQRFDEELVAVRFIREKPEELDLE